MVDENPNLLSKTIGSTHPSGGKLWGIGVGPGDGEWLTLKGLRVLQSVPVVACPQNKRGEAGMAYDIVKQYVRSHQTILPLTLPFVRDLVELQQAWDAAGQELINILSQGQDVAFITEGDASFFSTFTYVADAVHRFAPLVEITTVPGICSPMAAMAALRMPLAIANEKIAILPAVYDLSELEQALYWADVVVLMKVASVFKAVWKQLATADLLEQSSLVEWVGCPQETCYPTITALADHTPPYFSILIVRRHAYYF